jgi:hypothetical protein
VRVDSWAGVEQAEAGGLEVEAPDQAEHPFSNGRIVCRGQLQSVFGVAAHVRSHFSTEEVQALLFYGIASRASVFGSKLSRFNPRPEAFTILPCLTQAVSTEPVIWPLNSGSS